ncbi:MAG: sigma-54-dependent Fis family transcriptional regulator, partial [Betaproteobacteria bacterium]|nr:sigma-54-dependent Fis family transcriptional regulator [Betaproteobacteria bacterium]
MFCTSNLVGQAFPQPPKTVSATPRLNPNCATVSPRTLAAAAQPRQPHRSSPLPTDRGLGAFDFITKPFKNDEILLAVKNAAEHHRLEQENSRLKQSLRERYGFKNIIGKSAPMQQIFDLIAQVAPRRSTILIQGESGTGKELVAKAVHASSGRAGAPFVAINCGNIPSDLLESEIFGHVKGAYTGATASKKGLFEVANTGTLFLDEVGTISPEIQGKLLRVIQEREFRRLGGLENIKVDVRI